jgi:hypothetical protein
MKEELSQIDGYRAKTMKGNTVYDLWPTSLIGQTLSIA